MKRALLLLVLTGCAGSFSGVLPTDWGFSGIVVVDKDQSAIDVFKRTSSAPNGTTIICEGCGPTPKHIDVNQEGRFNINLGQHYDVPPPIKLHVKAPGYQPLDLVVERAGIRSQNGPTTLVVVLTPIGAARAVPAPAALIPADAGAAAPPSADPPPPPVAPDAGVPVQSDPVAPPG